MRSGRRGTSRIRIVVACLLMSVLLASCTAGCQKDAAKPSVSPHRTYVVPAGIHKIKHVIIIMQENRSFDSYFGTFPGATGFRTRHGVRAVCVPNASGRCTRPYHDAADINGGGPHNKRSAVADVNHGKMNGFIRQARAARKTCHLNYDPACAGRGRSDVMGYHTAAEIPNYWAYAHHFVLQDHMFEPVKSWSLPDHLYMVSAWSARCATRSPMSCRNAIKGPYQVGEFNHAVKQMLATRTTSIDLAWTDITWLLHAAHVSWSYFVQSGTQPDCENDSFETCKPVPQNARTPGIWNPLPMFGDVRDDRQTQNVKDLRTYF